MKVMIDTNVIISAALNPNSVSAASMYKALTYPYEPKHILNVLMENDMGKELNISQMKNHKNI